MIRARSQSATQGEGGGGEELTLHFITLHYIILHYKSKQLDSRGARRAPQAAKAKVENEQQKQCYYYYYYYH